MTSIKNVAKIAIIAINVAIFLYGGGLIEVTSGPVKIYWIVAGLIISTSLILASVRKPTISGDQKTRWLNYKARIDLDLDSFLGEEAFRSHLGERYTDKLSDSLKMLESWQIYLFGTQAAVIVFSALSILKISGSVSVLGISFSSNPIIKEIFLIVSTTLSVGLALIAFSKDIRIFTLEKISKQKLPPNMVDIGLLAVPSAFHMRIVPSRIYERWIFPYRIVEFLQAIAWIGPIILFIFIIAMSLFIQYLILREVYISPYSVIFSYYVVLPYCALSYLILLIWIFLFWVPLPYRDNEQLLSRSRFAEGKWKMRSRDGQVSARFGLTPTYI